MTGGQPAGDRAPAPRAGPCARSVCRSARRSGGVEAMLPARRLDESVRTGYAAVVMKLLEIPEDTLIRAPAAPRLMPGGECAVLILHGYTGNTGEVAYLGERINEAGYTVFIPRLPGHGTNGADFAQTTENDWLRASVDSYLELRRTHERVAVCGLSMGGLLALLLAARFDPAAVVALAPALRVNNRLFSFTPLVRLFVRKLSKPYTPRDEDDPDLIFLQREYWSYHWIPQIAGVYRLAQEARRALPRIEAPTRTILSEADQTVPVSVGRLITSHIGAEITDDVVLTESGHVLSNDIERDTVADLTVDWLQRHAGA